MKIELRDITQKKKEAQQELLKTITDVELLREEKEKLLKEINVTEGHHRAVIDLLKQEISFLEQEKKQSVRIKNETELVVSDLGVEKEALIANIETLKKTDIEALNNSLISKTEAREANELKDKIKQELSEYQIKKHEADTELRFINGKILLAESNLALYLKQIKEAEEKLESIKKEHSRHAQWDDYLKDKENFLIEQFKLLGVKYVVYNSSNYEFSS